MIKEIEDFSLGDNESWLRIEFLVLLCLFMPYWLYICVGHEFYIPLSSCKFNFFWTLLSWLPELSAAKTDISLAQETMLSSIRMKLQSGGSPRCVHTHIYMYIYTYIYFSRQHLLAVVLILNSLPKKIVRYRYEDIKKKSDINFQNQIQSKILKVIKRINFENASSKSFHRFFTTTNGHHHTIRIF
jgi:hypothetical protein